MVQRKVANKLAVQADQVKSNKLLVSLKPSSLQHLDTKNRGADMKKKIKKSRSLKRSDFECLSTPSLNGHQVSQPRKPPPSASPPSAAASPQKSPVRTLENTPNYMKSTSSSAARKEQSQVSRRNLLPLFDSKSSSKKNSNNSSEATSASVHQPERTHAARPSSLKLVRTLTKTTSFKPARALANKCCSRLALSENFNVQRATCSSALKDSKFPAYLTLDFGGTEAEGTSAIKVCPYNYCSLNGHHHPPLLPLKSFLSARRRMLKNQRSIKLGCLSPRRSKPNKEAMEEKEMEKVNFVDKSSSDEASNSSVMQQEDDDFFIHIYSKGTSKPEEADPLPSGASPNNHADSPIPESLLDQSPLSEVDFHENSDENSSYISRDMETAENSPEQNHNTKDADEVYPHFLARDKSGVEALSREHDEEESTGSIQIDDPESGHSDLDWEEGSYSKFYLDEELDNSRQTSQDYDLGRHSVKYDGFVINDGPIINSDGTLNRGFEDIQAGEILAKSFDEESKSPNADFHQDFEIDEHAQESSNQSHDQLELITMDGKNDEIKQSNLVEATVGYPVEEPSAYSEPKIKVDPQVEDAPFGKIQTEVDAFAGYCENQFVQDDDAAEQIGDLDSQDFHHMTAHSSTGECKDATGSQENVKLNQSDACIVLNCINFQASSASTPKKKDSQAETNCLKTDAGVGANEKEQVGPFRANITIEIIITLQDLSEAIKMKSTKDTEDNHLDAAETDGKPNQTMVDIDLQAEAQDHTSDEKFTAGGTENLNELEENEATNFTSCESTDSGDQPHSPTPEFSMPDNAEENSQDKEMESNTTSLAEETCPTSKTTSGKRTGDDLMQDNSDEELSKTCKKLKWISERKTSTEEQEEPKEFNPRAPNSLPLEPEQRAEKVDLRHQTINEQRNSEEWMLDYALQQAVTKLAPARKKKVALLVEAFEKVVPVPKCESQIRHASVGFLQSPRPIQAYS